MTTFTFTDTADKKEVEHVFQKVAMPGERGDVIVVRATYDDKWQRLADSVGDEWIRYRWLGPKPSVRSMVGTTTFATISEVPTLQLSTDVPLSDVE